MNVVAGFSEVKTTTAGGIESKGKTISKGKSTARLIYTNPLDHSLLNFAIIADKNKKIGKNIVPLKIQLGTEETTVWINVNSLAKRLGIQKKDIIYHHKSHDLEAFINGHIQAKAGEIAKEFEAREAKAWTPSMGHQPIESIPQSFKAKVSDILWALYSGSIDVLKLRSLLKLSSKTLDELSQARAAKAYRKAAKEVPAYKEFLKSNGVDKTTSFDQVPVTDKANYIKPNTLISTLIGGKLPEGGQFDTSTGTTGNPTTWVRSADERELNRKIINSIRKEVIGSAIFINAYSLGSLSTGMTVHNALVDENLLFSPGPDCDKVLDMILEVGGTTKEGSVSTEKIVITGYPSFMGRLIDRAEERGITLKDYNLTAIVGGESISEILRDRLTGTDPTSPGGFKKVISSYGASDLDINIGFETDFSVALRKACLKNPALARELFGSKEGSPMIFQYNPLFYYIESNEEGHLLYTSVSGKKISPRIRYDSHDIGMVMGTEELMKKLRLFNIDFDPPKTHLPFLFVWGREGTAATSNAAKVIPDELEQAIQEIPELKDNVENYALHSYENGGIKTLDFWIELKEGAEIDISDENNKELNDAILDHVRENSIDFKLMDDVAIMNGGIRPKLKLFPFGTGPMANQPSHKKKQYIYESIQEYI